MYSGTWIDTTDQDQHGACLPRVYSLASGSVRKRSVVYNQPSTCGQAGVAQADVG